MLYDNLWQTLPYFISSSRMPYSERPKNISMIFSSSIITPPPFRLHLYTTVSAANTTSNLKFFQENYTTLRMKLLVLAFAASLAALRRSSLYGAVRRKEKRPLRCCKLSYHLSSIKMFIISLLCVVQVHILSSMLPYKKLFHNNLLSNNSIIIWI